MILHKDLLFCEYIFFFVEPASYLENIYILSLKVEDLDKNSILMQLES